MSRDKNTKIISNNDWIISTSSMRGARYTQEDYICSGIFGSDAWACVLDGHGGDEVAKDIAAKFPSLWFNLLANSNPFSLNENITQKFLELDKNYTCSSGSCLNVVMVNSSKRELVCANVGDCRSGWAVDGTFKFISVDHKPNLENEKVRIQNAGMNVMNFGIPRIVSRDSLGGIAVSRAFGDRDYKNNSKLPPNHQAIVTTPDIYKLSWSDNNQVEFVITASDGLWDSFTTTEHLYMTVNHLFKQSRSVSKICEDLLDIAADIGSRDNITIGMVGNGMI